MTTYPVEDVLDSIGYIDTNPEPQHGEDVLDATLRVCYELPNIAGNEDVLRAVVQYASIAEGDVEELTLANLREYAPLFVQFYQDWRAVAERWLDDNYTGIVGVITNYMDFDKFGEDIAKDLGGYMAYEDGRIACFNKKEGQ